MKYLTVVVLLALPVVLSTCRYQDELPPVTMEGRNTFGCFVNGKLWLAEGRLGKSGIYAEIYKRPDTLAVNIYSSNDGQLIFMSIIDFPDLRINKAYDFNKDNCCGLQYLDFENTVSCSYELPVNGLVKFVEMGS